MQRFSIMRRPRVFGRQLEGVVVFNMMLPQPNNLGNQLVDLVLLFRDNITQIAQNSFVMRQSDFQLYDCIAHLGLCVARLGRSVAFQVRV